MNLPQRVPDPLLAFCRQGKSNILSELRIVHEGADSGGKFLIREAAEGLIGVWREALEQPNLDSADCPTGSDEACDLGEILDVSLRPNRHSGRHERVKSSLGYKQLGKGAETAPTVRLLARYKVARIPPVILSAGS